MGGIHVSRSLYRGQAACHYRAGQTKQHVRAQNFRYAIYPIAGRLILMTAKEKS